MSYDFSMFIHSEEVKMNLNSKDERSLNNACVFKRQRKTIKEQLHLGPLLWIYPPDPQDYQWQIKF